MLFLTPPFPPAQQGVFRTTDEAHPAVEYLMNQAGNTYVGGKVEGVALPMHYDFLAIRRTPAELRTLFVKMGWFKVRMHAAYLACCCY